MRFWWIMLALLATLPGAAQARVGNIAVSLRAPACTALLPDGVDDARVAAAAYRCGADAPAAGDGWLWMRLDATRLSPLPRDWALLVDQTRFDRIALLVVTDTGSRRETLSAETLGDHWAPGGVLRFEVAEAGADVRGLYLGFERIDDLSLMRKVRGLSTPAQARDFAGWLVLMGIFSGTLLSALLYNLVIHGGHRSAFQRWYIAWVAIAFVYGMVWTNTAAFLLHGFVGPWSMRLNYVLIGLMTAACNMFFVTVVEEGRLPPWLVRTMHGLAILGVVAGFTSAADPLLPVMPFDRALTYVVAATMMMLTVGCVVAIRNGSRTVWFYLIGWAPVIVVFGLRLARNLGLVGQSDFVDMATFGAMAFEALIFSLAIADRFRHLQGDLDQAAKRREIAQVEAEALRRAARTDGLTALANRAAHQHALRAAVDAGDPFMLMLVDIDHLKQVNDQSGHVGGDALIRTIAAILLEVTSDAEGAEVARIGGDEFALIVPRGVGADAAVIDRLAAAQGGSWMHGGQARTLTLSIGTARFPEDAPDTDGLYQNADLALYSAKRAGRARRHAYDPLLRILRDMQADFTRDADLALERGEFSLHLQPVVDLKTGAAHGHEALLRWQHPDHGLMLPDRFADLLVAERIGARIQDHVLDLAIDWMRRDADRIGILGVNFTAAQLAGPKAARRVLERLAAHGIPPAMLCVEVTEGVMLDRSAQTILATLKALHEAGVRIALDDFGTGHASLVHLRRMPVDSIKIDRSFVAGLDEEGGGTLAIVRAIIGLGHGLGKIVIAEGIETQAQADLLIELGCHLGQGYLYGRPGEVPMPGPGGRAAPPFPRPTTLSIA